MQKVKFEVMKTYRRKNIDAFEKNLKIAFPCIVDPLEYYDLNTSYHLLNPSPNPHHISYTSALMAKDSFDELIKIIKYLLPEQYIWLSFLHYEWVGLLKFKLSFLLDNYLKFLDFDGDTIIVFDTNDPENSKFTIDYTDGLYGGYEFSISGEWSQFCKHLLKR